MDKQTELKAKIGECHLELESLQARAKQVSDVKQQFTQALMNEINKVSKPIEGVKSVNQTGGITAKTVKTEKPKK